MQLESVHLDKLFHYPFQDLGNLPLLWFFLPVMGGEEAGGKKPIHILVG